MKNNRLLMFNLSFLLTGMLLLTSGETVWARTRHNGYPTPTPKPTASATATATGSPSATATASATASPTATATATATATPTPSATGFQVGINQTQLLWNTIPVIKSMMAAIAQDLPGVPWLRTDLQEIEYIPNFIEIVKDAHAQGKKVLAMVGPNEEDYTTSATFPFAVSQMSIPLFTKRLNAYMAAFVAAGVTVEAFEIGNELDSNQFNADVPTGSANKMTAAQIQTWQKGYANMLAAALSVIKNPAYVSFFSNVKVTTVGLANSMGYDPGDFIQNGPALVAGLKNFNGQNYLANVDGYGMHVYPAADTVTSFTQSVFATYQSAGLSDKPIWISEWGFHRNQFPYNGVTRAQADLQWLTYVKGYTGLKFGPAFLFDFDGDGGDYDLINTDGSLRTDEADVLNTFH